MTVIDSLPAAMADLLPAGLAGLFEQMEWGEDEVARAMKRHPAERDPLWHSFLLLKPTHEIMGTEFVYRSHCREILERVARNEDTRPGTAAEVCCVCSDMSHIAPMTTPGAGLYFRMWAEAFPHMPNPGGVDLSHYEALERPAIDELEGATRRKLAVPDRRLGAITCGGRHHGEDVQCKYAEL